jgi:hypothetical protein
MRPLRLLAALTLLVLAAFAALLAHDLRGWSAGVHAGDVTFAQSPRAASWSASTLLPGDPARSVLALSPQLAFRAAARSFDTVVNLGNGFDNGFSESRKRSALESRLDALSRGPDVHVDSEAENLLGILEFTDSKQRGPSTPTPVDRSLASFQAAVRLDPSNEDAKRNLEWLTQQLVAKGSRQGSNGSAGGPGKGRRGAGGGVPGRGY